MKILVVDDSKINRLFIKSILERHNHEIYLATNGLDALIQIAELMPDVIILDVMMPEMDGYEACRYISNNPDTQHIPVIILTSLDSMDDLVMAFNSGAMDFIRKPPRAIELVARVHSAMRIKQYQDRLKEMIIRDGLTGLYTHSYFISVLEREFSSVRRYDGDLGLILIDIDDFKRVNDTHGHLAGDKALMMVANLLMAGIRKSDIASRYGGEEFALLAPHSNLEHTSEVAERLRRTIEEACIVDGEHAFSITISAGVALTNANDRNYNDMIKRADEALYEAKRTGKNQVVISG